MSYEQKIFIIGDPHGSYIPFRDIDKYVKNNYQKLEEPPIIIVLGDFGGNFFLQTEMINSRQNLENIIFNIL